MGRRSKEANASSSHPSHNEADLPRKLMEVLIESKDLHVAAVATKGYRNKMLFGLNTCQTSDLGCPEVNQICETVFEWVQHRTTLPRAFWLDVSCKITLTGRAMLKLAVDQSQQAVPDAPDNDLNENGGVKPTKDDGYMIIHGAPYVLEQTPNGVPFALSPDTFCEVNHEMEDHVFRAISSWSVLASKRIQESEGKLPNLLTMGRNTNSLTFGLMRDSKLDPSEYGRDSSESGDNARSDGGCQRPAAFDSAFAITHCPLAHHDILTNTTITPGVIPPEHCFVCRSKPDIGSCVAALPDDRPIVVAVTAGRGGLHPNTVRAYKEKACIRAVIYDACNNPTLTRDMQSFLAGPHPWRISRFRSFDFFHGTDFSASVVLLSRSPRALLLPIGPCGAGKTVFTRQLCARLPPGSCRAFHRDEVFREERSAEGASLARAKEQTHARLMQALEAPAPGESVLVVDSTNGSPEGRRVYVEKYRPDVLVAVNFARSLLSASAGEEGAVDERLLESTMGRTEAEAARGVHPSFPAGAAQQLEKHRRVMRGITLATQEELEGAQAAAGPEAGARGASAMVAEVDSGAGAHDGEEGPRSREAEGSAALCEVFLRLFCEEAVAGTARDALLRKAAAR